MSFVHTLCLIFKPCESKNTPISLEKNKNKNHAELMGDSPAMLTDTWVSVPVVTDPADVELAGSARVKPMAKGVPGMLQAMKQSPQPGLLSFQQEARGKNTQEGRELKRMEGAGGTQSRKGRAG